MADEPIKYRRLGGAGHYPSVSRAVVVLLFFFIGILVLLLYRRRELFLGPDHLLTVDTNGYTEEYRFFNFSDIQAITVRGTGYYAAWIVVLTLVCAGFVFLGVQVEDTPGRVVFATLAGILGIALLVHLVKGPTVECKLKTAVSEIEIPSFGRLRRARAGVAEIRNHIEQAQGRMEVEDIARGIQERHRTSAVPAPDDAAADPPAQPAMKADVDSDEKDSGIAF